MFGKYQNQEGNPYCTKDWLDNHHLIKSRLRGELAQKLPIYRGAKILDVGCGTGIWSQLFAERVGHKGLVVGIDIDHDAIQLAETRRVSHFLKDNIVFKNADILSLDLNIKFDLIVAFNSLSYIKNTVNVLSLFPQFLRTNGTILIKDSDLSSDFFWPVDTELYHSIMLNLEKHKSDNSNSYDPFFARKIPGILKKCGYVDIDTMSQSFSFCYPVDQLERDYIAANGKMISDLAMELGDIDNAHKWGKQFFSIDSNCIFEDIKFLYTMTEFVFFAHAPASS